MHPKCEHFCPQMCGEKELNSRDYICMKYLHMGQDPKIWHKGKKTMYNSNPKYYEMASVGTKLHGLEHFHLGKNFRYQIQLYFMILCLLS